jgi:surfeit locus 1 family protein
VARRSATARAALGLAVGVTFVVLIALGTWQVQRRAWKLDLIARVDERVQAPPAAPPDPSIWSAKTAEASEYRHVIVRGSFRNDRETPVQAVTVLGPGYWILTPLETGTGSTILVNRGFVPSDRRDPATRPAGQPTGDVTVVGLLRLSEPHGGFLRSNDPAQNRWYSRDVQAIAAARDLGQVAPYFIDADGTANRGGLPVGGLTVVQFPNSHLIYALTWYGLAALLAGAVGWTFVNARRGSGAEPPP